MKRILLVLFAMLLAAGLGIGGCGDDGGNGGDSDTDTDSDTDSDTDTDVDTDTDTDTDADGGPDASADTDTDTDTDTASELGAWVDDDGRILRLGDREQPDWNRVFAWDDAAASCDEALGNYVIAEGVITFTRGENNACSPFDICDITVAEDELSMTLECDPADAGVETYEFTRVTDVVPPANRHIFVSLDDFGCGEIVDMSYFEAADSDFEGYAQTNSWVGADMYMDEMFSYSMPDGFSSWGWYDADDTGRSEALYPTPAGLVHQLRGLRDANLQLLSAVTFDVVCDTGVLSNVVEYYYDTDITRHRFLSGGTFGETAPGTSAITAADAPTSLAEVEVYFDSEFTPTDLLTVTLTSPDATAVVLVGEEGGASEFIGPVIFSDDAAASIYGSSGNREGMYQPEGDLADFVGEDGNGTWTLSLTTSGTVTGVLTNWSLSLR